MGRSSGAVFWVKASGLVAARPSLWTTAARQAVRLARPRWRRRFPYLPLPDREYLRFRFETQYGTDGPLDPHDLVTYLEWCRSMDAGRP